MGTGTTIIIGLLTRLIYDTLKYSLSFAVTKDNKMLEGKKSIEDFFKTKDFANFNDLLESGIFLEYIQSPQVRDLIYDYFFYAISGRKTKDIKETEIFSYLADNLLRRYEKPITKPKKEDVESFFRFSFSCLEDYVQQFITDKDRYIISSIYRAVEFNANETHGKIDTLISLIKDSMSLNIIERQHNYIQIRNDYMNTLQDKNKKAHIYLLDYFDLNKFYVPPLLKLMNNSKLHLEKYKFHYAISGSYFEIWKDIFFESNIIYIIGGAGYGKSLFMKNIINNFNSLNLFDVQEHIVIYGELKKFFHPNSNHPMSVIEFLQDSMIAATGIDKQHLSKEFIQYYLNLGRCIILLDALDEVDKLERRDLHEKIIAYFKNNNPHNKICITSRARGFIPMKEIISCFEIFPLERKQIEKYVDNIIKLNKFPKADKESFLKQADKLIQKRFLNSFLVLSLLINIYKAERELPENKLELYQKCFEYIATRREKEKMQIRSKEGQFDWEVIGLLMKESTFIELANLTFPNNTEVSKEKIKEHLIPIYKNKYGNEAKADNAIEVFLNFCSERTELFVPSLFEEKYKFFHRTFFEYFYSLHIFMQSVEIEDIYNKLKQFDVDSEVFELTIAMFKKSAEEKYQRIIEFIFDKIKSQFDTNEDNYIALNMLILMLQVIDDVAYRDNFINIIIQYKDRISMFPNKVLNNDIIMRLILVKDTYIESINKVYYFDSIGEILLLLPDISKMSVDILGTENIDKDIQHFITLGRDYTQKNHFYTAIFVLTNNIYEILNNFEIKEAIFPKKIREKCNKAYKIYKSFDDEKRKKICYLFTGKNS